MRSPYASIVTADWITAHRIAVRDRERRVGKRREQRRESARGAAATSAPSGSGPRRNVSTCKHLLHVRVVRALVEGEVEVAPRRARVRAIRACTTRSRGLRARSPPRSRSGTGGASRAAAAPSASARRSRVRQRVKRGSTPSRRGPSPGRGHGSRLSQYGSERSRVSAAMRLTRCVVPERGSPITMIGRGELDVEDLGAARARGPRRAAGAVSSRSVRWWIASRPSGPRPVSASTAAIIASRRARKSGIAEVVALRRGRARRRASRRASNVMSSDAT